MGQPVKLSDALVWDARLSSELTERSIAGQIEFWAGLGRAVESLMRFGDVLALKQSGAAKPLLECLREVDSAAGRQRLAQVLNEGPFPHYEPAPDRPGWLVRIEADGTRTEGRFIKRQFVTTEAE